MKNPSSTELLRQAGLKAFLLDRIAPIFICLATLALVIIFSLALHIDVSLIILIAVLFTTAFVLSFTIEYLRRRRFYRALFVNLATLDRAHLVLETLEEPTFFDGKLLHEALYVISKSMQEEIHSYAEQSREFQEYIEMWIHEVKTPLAALMLLNSKSDAPTRRDAAAEIQRIDNYVEQVLYFVRAENAERDYLIAHVSLAKLVGAVASRYQNALRSKNINFVTRSLNLSISTDAKWLEFILGQIINNSIKYGATKIEISATEKSDIVLLTIQDNGIGIDAKDLPRVFDKSFTGSNGRHSGHPLPSTGMGLYIAKSLCERLGHGLNISSVTGEGTTVELTFRGSKFYDVASRKSH